MEGQQNYLNLRIKKPSQERMQHYLYVWLLFACICSPDTCHTVASCSNLDYFGTVFTVSRKKGNQMIIGALRSWAECVMASNKWVRALPSHTDS